MKDPRPPGPPENLADVPIYGTANRIPLVLCLDTSESMQGEPIELLNRALRDWVEELRNDTNLAHAVDVAVVTFGRGGVTTWRGPEPLSGQDTDPFVSARAFRAPTLQADDLTPMGEALERVLELVDRRKVRMRQDGVHHARPQICLLTDGWPSDEWKHLPDRLAEDARFRRYRLFAVGIGNIGEQGRNVLKAFAPVFNAELEDFRIRELLEFMSASADNAGRGDSDDPLAKRWEGLIRKEKPDGPKRAL